MVGSYYIEIIEIKYKNNWIKSFGHKVVSRKKKYKVNIIVKLIALSHAFI